jgi:NAD(P)-dependent dehydrogenase (short-subunit alcohol dehydrogenase family)
MGTTVGVATGAGRGMGRACAIRLARTVDVVIGVDLDQEALTSLRQDLGGSTAHIESLALDVSDPADMARLAEAVSGFGSLRAVAHAAGISPTMADWRRVLAVDLVGTARLLEALRPLAVTGTAFVCFASMAATLVVSEGSPADAPLDDPLAEEFLALLRESVGPAIEEPGIAYAWAKRGVQRLVRREAVGLGRVGARICSLSPGMIDTPQGRQEMEQQPVMHTLLEQTPLGRLGTAGELAAVAAFLLSDEASFVTGTDVLVDGGVVAAMQTSWT